MYDSGYARKTILELFRIIDWMILLPAALDAAVLWELNIFEELSKVP